ncbi:hypothetical protein [Kamptonema formosum]|uniref:hypothetical protein n=1 Tax=Kamptonema formosum TaxID=331992 RepID=UPI00034D603F|nr:hypothetical protein [Oscillatoria sp. PCC 10802]
MPTTGWTPSESHRLRDGPKGLGRRASGKAGGTPVGSAAFTPLRTGSAGTDIS